MSQIKIFGLRSSLSPVMKEVSDVIHSCVVDALNYPVDKRAHRFFPLETGEFFYPAGRTERYTIIDYRGLEALGEKRTWHTVDSYLAYLEHCRKLARENGVSLRELDRALWQWSVERGTASSDVEAR